jgi:hypothetical protein
LKEFNEWTEKQEEQDMLSESERELDEEIDFDEDLEDDLEEDDEDQNANGTSLFVSSFVSLSALTKLHRYHVFRFLQATT